MIQGHSFFHRTTLGTLKNLLSNEAFPLCNCPHFYDKCWLRAFRVRRRFISVLILIYSGNISNLSFFVSHTQKLPSSNVQQRPSCYQYEDIFVIETTSIQYSSSKAKGHKGRQRSDGQTQNGESSDLSIDDRVVTAWLDRVWFQDERGKEDKES